MASVVAFVIIVGMIGMGLTWIARCETEHLENSATDRGESVTQPLLSSEG
ncbi:hypothetical protein OS242_09380 [Tumebacillus sp. DT12]|uniref:YtzI protein n=1 Tax=Tumebacillus lacus TaxID=2995335 RepID=A0ABT3X2J2_9BACL|nr:hypothetical protein [Tumebacillus lacus]MCX7570173.1 hypothetical protein [Tumebacillus lacus]